LLVARRLARVLQVATIVAFGGCAVLLYRIVAPGPTYEQPELDGKVIKVRDAIAVSKAEPLTVRGFVFQGPGARELRLCDGRKTGSPPSCIGPFVSIRNADRGQFVLEQATAGSEGTVYYSAGSVSIIGTVVGTVLTVDVVLR
jgi:hypothetical protein